MAQRNLFETARNTLEEPLDVHVSRLSPAWAAALQTPAAQAALKTLHSYLADRLQAGAQIFPRHPFRALSYMEPDAVRVIILGQDPYHGANQAQGLAFSVPDACPRPPSLRNIFKEIALEYPGTPLRQRNDLEDWARQGVLLLNAALTVEAQQPGSHARKGWEQITDALIHRVAETPQPKVFLLWGAHAQSKQKLLAEHKGGPMLVLTANHPSPLSAQRPPVPFIGCGHFEKANAWLQAQGLATIDWLQHA